MSRSGNDKQPRLNWRQCDELGRGVLKATGVTWIVAAAKAIAVVPAGPIGTTFLISLIDRDIQMLDNAVAREQFIANLREQGATEEEVKNIMSVLERNEF